MKNNNKRKNMNNFKKVGLTALAGSLAAVSAHAAEMGVSGASVLTYTSGDATEVTGNPLGMKTNLSFTASGDVNGYTVSYMQTSADQFAGMSSARLSVDMGDMGTIAFDQGSGSGLATIDDKTPTAAEEIWDGLDASASTTDNNGLVGAAGSTGVINYVKSYEGISLNAAFRGGSAASNADGGVSGAGQGAWDFALTTDGSSIGVDGLAIGGGYGKASTGESGATSGDEKHSTVFANYSVGMLTFGYQVADITMPGNTGVDERTDAWGVAININENLSVSYGEREVEYNNPTAANVVEAGEGIAVAYTMGSMKIAGNMNEVSNNDNATGSAATDEMTEVAISFAF
jgi:outer membrane protein OmpU